MGFIAAAFHEHLIALPMLFCCICQIFASERRHRGDKTCKIHGSNEMKLWKASSMMFGSSFEKAEWAAWLDAFEVMSDTQWKDQIPWQAHMQLVILIFHRNIGLQKWQYVVDIIRPWMKAVEPKELNANEPRWSVLLTKYAQSKDTMETLSQTMLSAYFGNLVLELLDDTSAEGPGPAAELSYILLAEVKSASESAASDDKGARDDFVAESLSAVEQACRVTAALCYPTWGFLGSTYQEVIECTGNISKPRGMNSHSDIYFTTMEGFAFSRTYC